MFRSAIQEYNEHLRKRFKTLQDDPDDEKKGYLKFLTPTLSKWTREFFFVIILKVILTSFFYSKFLEKNPGRQNIQLLYIILPNQFRQLARYRNATALEVTNISR